MIILAGEFSCHPPKKNTIRVAGDGDPTAKKTHMSHVTRPRFLQHDVLRVPIEAKS